jgi:SAM-dependent methyltransferase
MKTTPSGTDPVKDFYDGWADEYHLIFADWVQSVKRQGKVLGDLIRSQLGEKAETVLDCTCGIGTQSIGLASRGFRVTASDLSPKAVERALKEAETFGVKLTGRVADLRTLDRSIAERFDVVLTGDNSICHLIEESDLRLAAKQMRARVRPGGLFLGTIRDYDALKKASATESVSQQLPGDFKPSGGELPRATIPRVFDDDRGRRIVFQVWDWSDDGKSYGVNQFCVTQRGDSWQTSYRASRFRALLRGEWDACLEGAGFKAIRWHMPEETGFYQPIVTARA